MTPAVSGLLSIAAVSVLSATVGCTSGAGASEAGTTADSAGVTIVTNPVSDWSEGDAWAIDPTPGVTIGVAEGDPAQQLAFVRGALSLTDGRILIANGRPLQLRFYDAKGGHLLDVGRQGEGPGEFGELLALDRTAGDSISVYDRRLERGTLFDADGKLARTFRISPLDGWFQPSVRKVFPDGTLLVSAQETGERPKLGTFMSGNWVYSRFAADGTYRNEIARGVLGATWGFESPRGGVAYTLQPFVLQTPLAVSDGASLFVGHGSGPEIEQRDLDGKLVRVVRWAGEPKAVTPEVIAQYRSTMTESITDPAMRRSTEALMAEIPFPPRMPAYQTLLVDPLGHLWVEQYRPSWDEDVRWWVFDEDGTWMGEVRSPAGVRIRDIGVDYVLGTWLDDLDVEHVSRYSLARD